MFFCYENKVIFPIYLSDQKFDNVLDLLLVNNHYVYIKDFNGLMFKKNKCKNKNGFVTVAYVVLVGKLL